jgi:hypothetical protein
MRTSKRFGNAAVTKRVDKESGRHRARRSPDEPMVCEVCKAVYSDRRWISRSTMLKSADKRKNWPPTESTICPACQQQREGVPGGFVYVEGAFLLSHLEEIERLIANEAERAATENPLSRLMKTERVDKDLVIVSTTDEHLAMRLGHALEKAFAGKVRYGFSHENKLVRVRWHRD